MVRTLLLGTAVIVLLLYMLANFALPQCVRPRQACSQTNTVGADLMRLAVGGAGAIVLSLIVCVCALSTLNATIFTGARTYYALGRDLSAIRALGVWDERGDKPANALLLQGAIALALVVFGAFTRDGFEAMVAYTAPVFWFVHVPGGAVGVRLPQPRHRPRSTTACRSIPLPPILLRCGGLGLDVLFQHHYAGVGSLAGIVVLLAGTPLLLLKRSPA